MPILEMGAEPHTLLAGQKTITRGMVAVVIPAHDEEAQIGNTLDSLYGQTVPPDFIMVVADNCTDNTVECALDKGAEVIVTHGNIYKKAGALNDGIGLLLQQSTFPEFVITIDADTSLDKHFVERALNVMANNPKLGGLSAVCRGKPKLGRGLIQKILVWYQRAEYTRAGFVRIRRNIHTLSGAGTVMRAEAIFDVLSGREHLYEQRPTNLVEDFETTLKMKSYGWKCTNNYHTVAYTDLMVTFRALFRQRLRWVGGTIDELRRHGFKRESRVSILTMMYGFLGIPVYYAWFYLFWQNIQRGAGWLDVWFIFCVAFYQGITLRRMGWRSMIVGFLIVPEILYMLFRHTWLFASLARSYTTKQRRWE